MQRKLKINELAVEVHDIDDDLYIAIGFNTPILKFKDGLPDEQDKGEVQIERTTLYLSLSDALSLTQRIRSIIQ